MENNQPPHEPSIQVPSSPPTGLAPSIASMDGNQERTATFNPYNQPQPSNNRIGLMVLGGAVLMLLLMVGATFLLRSSDDAIESSVPTFSDQDVEAVIEAGPNGETLAGLTPLSRYSRDAETDSAINQKIDEFSWINPDGETVGLVNNGKPKAIYFLAHWCPHCQTELATIESLAAEDLIPADVEFIAVATLIRSGSDNYPPSEWLADSPFDQVVIDIEEPIANSLYTTFGGTGVPYVLYVDSEMNLIERKSGEVSREGMLRDWQDLAAG